MFSAHSQPIQNELLPFSSNALSSRQGHSSDWERRNDLPISSSWVSDDHGAGNSNWDREQLRAGPSDWSRTVPSDWEPGASLPGPSGLEQAVPEQLTLEGDDQDSKIFNGLPVAVLLTDTLITVKKTLWNLRFFSTTLKFCFNSFRIFFLLTVCHHWTPTLVQ